MSVFKFLKAGGVATLAFFVAATAILLGFAYWNATGSSLNECAMTYYDGSLDDVDGAPDHPLYSLHEYHPSSSVPAFPVDSDADAREEIVLYVPGNAGDAFQSRSLATHVFDLAEEAATNLDAVPRALSAAPPALIRSGRWRSSSTNASVDGATLRTHVPSRVRVFALSFAEELTALSPAKASEQAAYTARVLAFLASLAGPSGPKNSGGRFRSPGISVVGHSMGGVVALAAADTLLAQPTVSEAAGDAGVPHTVVTVGTPLASPVAAVDAASITRAVGNGTGETGAGAVGAGAGLYAAAARAAASIPVLCLSGGERDEQVSQPLTYPAAVLSSGAALGSGAAGVSGSFPVSPAADHKCLVWCRQLVKPLAATLLRRVLLSAGLGEGAREQREPLSAAATSSGLSGVLAASADAKTSPIAAAAALWRSSSSVLASFTASAPVEVVAAGELVVARSPLPASDGAVGVLAAAPIPLSGLRLCRVSSGSSSCVAVDASRESLPPPRAPVRVRGLGSADATPGRPVPAPASRAAGSQSQRESGAAGGATAPSVLSAPAAAVAAAVSSLGGCAGDGACVLEVLTAAESAAALARAQELIAELSLAGAASDTVPFVWGHWLVASSQDGGKSGVVVSASAATVGADVALFLVPASSSGVSEAAAARLRLEGLPVPLAGLVAVETADPAAAPSSSAGLLAFGWDAIGSASPSDPSLWTPRPVPVPVTARCLASSGDCGHGLALAVPVWEADMPQFVSHAIRAESRAALSRASKAAAAAAAAADGRSEGWGVASIEGVTVDVLPSSAARRLVLSPAMSPLVPFAKPASGDVAATVAGATARVTLIPAPAAASASSSQQGSAVASLAAVPLPWTALAKAIWGALPGSLALMLIILLMRPAAAAVVGGKGTHKKKKHEKHEKHGRVRVKHLARKGAIIGTLAAAAVVCTGVLAERPDLLAAKVTVGTRAVGAVKAWSVPLQCAYWGDSLAPQLCPQSLAAEDRFQQTRLSDQDKQALWLHEVRKLSPTGMPLLTVTPLGAPIMSSLPAAVCPSTACAVARGLARTAVWVDAHTAPLAATAAACVALVAALLVSALYSVLTAIVRALARAAGILPALVARPIFASGPGRVIARVLLAPLLLLSAAVALVVAGVNVQRSGAVGHVWGAVKAASGSLMAAISAASGSVEASSVSASASGKQGLLLRVVIDCFEWVAMQWEQGIDSLFTAAASAPAPWSRLLTVALNGGETSPVLFPLPLVPVTPLTLCLLLALAAAAAAAAAASLRPAAVGKKRSRWGASLVVFIALALLPALTLAPHSALHWADTAAAAAPVAIPPLGPEEPAPGVDGWLPAAPAAAQMVADARARREWHPISAALAAPILRADKTRVHVKGETGGAWSLPASAISLARTVRSYVLHGPRNDAFAAAARSRAGLPPLSAEPALDAPPAGSVGDVVLATALPVAVAGDVVAPRPAARPEVFAAAGALALLLALALLQLRGALLATGISEKEVSSTPAEQSPEQPAPEPERELFAPRPANRIPPLRLTRRQELEQARLKAEAEAKEDAKSKGSEHEDEDKALSPFATRALKVLRVLLLVVARAVIARRLFAGRAAAGAVGAALQRTLAGCSSFHSGILEGAGACLGGVAGVMVNAVAAVVEITTGGGSGVGWVGEAVVLAMGGIVIDAVEAILTEM